MGVYFAFTFAYSDIFKEIVAMESAAAYLSMADTCDMKYLISSNDQPLSGSFL